MAQTNRHLAFFLRRVIKRLTILGPFEGVTLALERFIGRLRPRASVDLGARDVLVPVHGRLRLALPVTSPSVPYLINQAYEPEVTRLFCDLTDPGMTVVDVGANVGYYSLLAGDLVGQHGHVYAFEPDPSSYLYLERNVEMNNLKSVILSNLAIGSHHGTERLTQGDPERSYLTNALSEGAIQVETTTLDRFFSLLGWPPVAIVKMDIEGSECAALQGM